MEVSDTTSDGREGQRTGSLRQHHLGAGLYIQVNTAFRNAPAFVWPNVPPASSDAPVAPLPPHCDRAFRPTSMMDQEMIRPPLAQPGSDISGQRPDRGISYPQVGAHTGLSVDQGTLGLP